MPAGAVACAVAITACATNFEKTQKSGSIQSDTTPKIMVNRKWLGYANEISIQFSSSGEVFQTYFYYTAPKQPVGIIGCTERVRSGQNVAGPFRQKPK